MARLHEFQGKAILRQHGLAVPAGQPASTPQEAAEAARRVGCPCVVKIQAWTTGRAAIGGVAFAQTPEEASTHAQRMLQIKVGNFPVTHVLVEEKLSIVRELFFSLSIDDRARAPVILISSTGGSGVEERAGAVQRIACDVTDGPSPRAIESAISEAKLDPSAHAKACDAIKGLFKVARAIDARSLEINPLVLTKDGRIVCADCRVTIDDYAVFRHPELGIEIARELDHPPTSLERIAYQCEQDDHRGTFYFAQLATEAAPGSRGLVGFHGAGGGGSMMSMDAVTNEGFTIANFTDTSGNPSAAKVYRAARIILQQPGLVGYFGSGSGVASQEQFWSAYGLAKAFWEMNLDIPAVIRLGGNTEDRAVEILHAAAKSLPTRIEAFKKTDPPAKIAARFRELTSETSPDREGGVPGPRAWKPRPPRRPGFVGSPHAFSFDVKQGKVWIDPAAWRTHASAIIARANGLLRDDHGKPALTLKPDEFAAKDSDMIACEVECRRDGVEGFFVELFIPGL